MARDCVTHHHACDCREARFREIEAERDALREQRNHFENASSALSEQLTVKEGLYDALKRENEALATLLRDIRNDLTIRAQPDNQGPGRVVNLSCSLWDRMHAALSPAEPKETVEATLLKVSDERNALKRECEALREEVTTYRAFSGPHERWPGVFECGLCRERWVPASSTPEYRAARHIEGCPAAALSPAAPKENGHPCETRCPGTTDGAHKWERYESMSGETGMVCRVCRDGYPTLG